MNDLARQSLELNNEAVSLMLAGEDKKAATALAEAIAVMKRLLLHPAASPTGTEEESKSSTTTARVCRDLSSQDAGVSAASTSGTKSIDQCVVFHGSVVMSDMHDQTGSNFIYNRAIVLDARPKAQRETALDLQAYSACFIFNLALLYHRRGVNQRSAHLLTQAAHAYELAKKCVCPPLALKHKTAALSISLAATNNISLIQFDQGNFSEARQGLHCLADLIEDSAENSRDIFSAREWDGFQMNIMLLLNPPGSAPAA
jgi:hypothetical protein